MLCLTVSKHEHKFVPGTIKGAHAPVALDPNAKVQEIPARGTTCREHFAYVAPIHARIDNRAWIGVSAEHREGLCQEPRKLALVHLTRGHRKLWVRLGAVATYVAIN